MNKYKILPPLIFMDAFYLSPDPDLFGYFLEFIQLSLAQKF